MSKLFLCLCLCGAAFAFAQSDRLGSRTVNAAEADQVLGGACIDVLQYNCTNEGCGSDNALKADSGGSLNYKFKTVQKCNENSSCNDRYYNTDGCSSSS